MYQWWNQLSKQHQYLDSLASIQMWILNPYGYVGMYVHYTQSHRIWVLFDSYRHLWTSSYLVASVVPHLQLEGLGVA